MGECFFWYRPTRVVPDKRPLNGCVCVCVCVVSYLSFSLAAISCHHYISKFLDDCISNLFVDFCKLVKIVLKKDDLLTLSLDT